jgi:hypothetical protein
LFINCSDLSMEVAIDEPGMLENLANELNYRLALTLNTLVQLTSDAATAIDTNVNIQLAANSFLTANNIRSAVQSLLGANARPLTTDGKFGGIMHPNVVRDVFNDTSFNGLTDILKRGGDSERAQLMAVPDNDDVVDFGGAKFKQSTTAPTTTIGGNTFYNTYLYGDDAIFSIFLGKNPESDQKNYKLNIQLAPEAGSVSDPARMIGGYLAA